MGVDLKIVQAYGYLIPCGMFERMTKDIQQKLIARKQQSVTDQTRKGRSRDRSLVRKPVSDRSRSPVGKPVSDRNRSPIRTQDEQPPRLTDNDRVWYGVDDGDDIYTALSDEAGSVGFLDQDGYGDPNKTARVFLYWADGPDFSPIMNRKLSEKELAPKSYPESKDKSESDEIRETRDVRIIGGARDFFSVAVDGDFHEVRDKNPHPHRDDLHRHLESEDTVFYQEISRALRDDKYKTYYHKWLVSGYC